jgi:3-hydroxyisobutyrate dehydrogenase
MPPSTPDAAAVRPACRRPENGGEDARMTTLGFIGVGAMGAPMAANLVKAGFEVVVHDADPARAAAVAAELDCRSADGLAAVAACDLVITMLPDGRVVQDVLLKEADGAFLAAAGPHTVVVDMSSSEPALTRATGAALKASGVGLVDAPVSGGVPRAKTGELAIMIGTDDAAALEAARPALQALGKSLFEVGPLGAGHAMKALNNYVAAATFAAASEALAVGRTCGLTAETMVSVFNVSTGRSFITEIAMKDHVLTGKHASGFALGLLAKDVRIAAELAADSGAEAPIAALVKTRWAEARDMLGPTRDNTEAILAWYPEMENRDG